MSVSPVVRNIRTFFFTVSQFTLQDANRKRTKSNLTYPEACLQYVGVYVHTSAQTATMPGVLALSRSLLRCRYAWVVLSRSYLRCRYDLVALSRSYLRCSYAWRSFLRIQRLRFLSSYNRSINCGPIKRNFAKRSEMSHKIIFDVKVRAKYMIVTLGSSRSC